MASSRDTNGTTDRLYLNGSGSALTGGFSIVWIGRLVATSAGGDTAICSITNVAGGSLGCLFHNSTSNLAWGSSNDDSIAASAFSFNLTDIWALGFSKASGSTVARLHARNLTAAGTGVHVDGAVARTIPSGVWDRTEIGTGSNGGFAGSAKRHGVLAVFAGVLSDANFDGIVNSTAALHALSPLRLWDFNQASTGTAVVNLETGSSDQTSITGTSVTDEAALNFWTFGLGATQQQITGTAAGVGSAQGGLSAGVSYMGTGTAATATSGDVTANYPTGASAPLTGDIIVCVASSRDNVSLTFPAGWTKKAEANNGTGLRQTIAYHRRAGGESETSVAVTHTAGAQIIARVHVVRGAVSSGDPFEASAGPTSVTSGSTGAFPDVTTLATGDLLFYALAYQEDFTVAPSITNAQGLTLADRGATEVA